MKNTLTKTLSLAVVAVAVSACAACPRGADYAQVPYTHERTAGQGLYVYDGNCKKETTVQTTTTGEAVFQTRVRK